jgi:hypothetical protein
MKRIVGFFAGLVGVAALAASSSADPFGAFFDDLITELEHRVADDYPGDLDATQKKELKACQKALATFAKEADDLGDDLKNGGKAIKGLAKAFPSEFTAPGSHDGTLGPICSAALGDLEDEIADLLDEQDGRTGSLSEKGAAKVLAILEKANAGLDGAGAEDQPAWAKQLLLAYKAALKAAKTADKDLAKIKDVLEFTVNGTTYKAGVFGIGYDDIIGTLVISGATKSLPAHQISVTPDSFVFAPGTFGVAAGSYNFLGIPPKAYIGTSGTVTVTALDTVAGRVAGTFSFTGNDPLGGGNATVTGTFNSRYNAGVSD